MKILILGGTGAMGIHLVELLKAEHQLFVTSRRRQKQQEKVHYIQGDGKDLLFVRKILQEERWDVIVDFMVYTTAEFEERYALFLKHTAQYIFLSSARVYADQHSIIKESSPRLLDVSTDDAYLASDEYALAKARQEDLLYNAEQRNWTIIRPYITYSENRFQLGVLEKEEWLYRAMKGRTIVFSEEMMQRFTTLTYGFDVARGMAKVIGNSASFGNTFHITGNAPAKWEQVLKIYLSLLRQKLNLVPRIKLVDTAVFLEIKRGRYQILYDRLYDRRFDNQRINALIAVDDFREMQSGLSACMDIFLNAPSFLTIDWRKEAQKDRLTKEGASLSEISGVKNKFRYLLYRYIKNV
ncbi:NAD-dependent epimerase/dehydratase family protein [Niabella pedocola]|uniref:NAD-dependent epimerase/dehydratase family protein n=1 Tax=Niabella pedocola TaxID=1752077 RepID=A0ABS8PX80_9BACT|nr:NAD-dependent epimerase/dehydratase family protein [Niabella pedocola]MCD2425449.1 NAD-dependent epimerase/dehydratase family protein [Niabella pedocola]